MATEIRASHIILKHDQSRNPVCRRTQKTITRSQNEAAASLEDLRKKITPENFSQYASEISECSSFRNGGDLGFFGKGVMDANFEKAAFSLKVNEISPVVNSSSGCHLILRTA